jgi:hypothetical protein
VLFRSGPHLGIDVAAVFPDHIDGRHELALFAGQRAIGHRRQPDIGIEPDLVTGVAAEHGTASWLRQVANEQPVPADFLGLASQALKEVDELRMSPIDPEVWTHERTELIRTAARDPDVERIFVNAAIKKALCREAGLDRDWLGKVRPW